MGWIMSSKNSPIGLLTTIHHNMILLEEKIFIEVMKLIWSY